MLRTWHKSFLLFAVALGSAIGAPSYSSAVNVGDVLDFQDGSTEGFLVNGSGLAGFPITFLPENLADTGPGGIGDNALQLSTTGFGFGAGHALVVLNNSTLTGDYTAAGITALSIDVANPNPADLNLRINLVGDANDSGGPDSGDNGGFVSNDIVVPADSGFQTITFLLDESNFINLEPVGGLSFEETLSDVVQFRLIHNPDAVATPQLGAGGVAVPTNENPIVATVLIDNVSLLAVPEPAGALLAAVGLAGLAGRRRR